MNGHLFTRLASEAHLSPKRRRWTGNDRTQRHHHGEVPAAQTTVDMVLKWKTGPRATPRLIGYFRLHLDQLCAQGYVGRQKDGQFRLRFYHGPDDCIYIEPLFSPRRRLAIGKYEDATPAGS